VIDVERPIRVVPANQATWEDLQRIFGTRGRVRYASANATDSIPAKPSLISRLKREGAAYTSKRTLVTPRRHRLAV